MRVKQSLLILASCACLTGCSIVGNATHNVLTEIHQHEEDHQERKRDRELARKAWTEWQCSRDEADSEAFGDGFRAGYADYLYAGGDGQPPAMPPRKYWRVSYETPDGRQATEDWFAGFRTGAAEAKRSGLREFVVLSTSVSCPAPQPAPAALSVAPAPALQEAPLPAPQPLPTRLPTGIPAVEPAPKPRPITTGSLDANPMPEPTAVPEAPPPVGMTSATPVPSVETVPPQPTAVPEPPPLHDTTTATPARTVDRAPHASIVRVIATEGANDTVIPRATVLAVHARPAVEN